jgi:hypothetical protein
MAPNRILVLRLAIAKRHQVDVFGDDLAGHFGHQIDAFLFREPANDAQQRPIDGLRRQAHFRQELRLDGALAAQVKRRKVRRN